MSIYQDLGITPNVTEGTAIPTPLITDKENDTYIRSNATGTIIGTYTYNGTAWILTTGADDLVDVTGVTFPLAFPLVTLPGTPVFSPNTPATVGLTYAVTDVAQTQLIYTKWTGTQYISAPTPKATLFDKQIVADLVNTTIVLDIPLTTHDQTSRLTVRQTIVDSNITFAGTNFAEGKILRLHNSRNSTHKISYNGNDIYPGQYLDLNNDGKTYCVEVQQHQDWEEFDFISPVSIIPATTGSQTTPTIVPNSHRILTNPGDYLFKYVVTVSCSGALDPQVIGNAFNIARINPIVGAVEGTVGSIAGTIGTNLEHSFLKYGTGTANEKHTLTKYIRLRTTLPNEIVALKWNVLQGSSIMYQSATDISEISYKRYRTTALNLNPRFGTTTPSINGTEKAGQTYFRNKDGGNSLQPYEEYIFTGTTWYRVDGEDNYLVHPLDQAPGGICPAGATSYLDFNGGYSSTITFPTAVGRKNEIFTVNHDATLDATILGTNRFPNNTILLTTSIRSLRFISDGTNWYQVGNDNDLSIIETSATSVTAPDINSTIILNSTATQTLTIPNPIGITKRLYIIVNNANIDKVLSLGYTKFNGINLTTIPSFASITIQSNGSIWKQIDGWNSKLDNYGTLTNRGVTTSNTATTLGFISAAIDLNSTINIVQTINDTVLTLAPPVVSTAMGRFLRISNDNTSTKNIIYLGVTITPATFLDLHWNGVQWIREASETSLVGTSDNLSVNRITSNQNFTGIVNTTPQDLLFNNIISGNIPFNTTTGIATLTANKTYNIRASLSMFGGSAKFFKFAVVDGVSNVVISPAAECISVTSSSSNASPSFIDFNYKPTTNQTIKLRAISGDASTGEGVRFDLYSGMTITQIGSTATTTTTRAIVRANTMTATASGGTGTAIIFTNEELDTTNSFNPATGTFIAPRTGEYSVSCQFFVGASNVAVGNRFGVILSTNGGGFGAGSPIITYYAPVTNPANAVFGGSYTKTLTAGQSLTFRAFLDTATSMSLAGNANFDYITITEINPTF